VLNKELLSFDLCSRNKVSNRSTCFEFESPDSRRPFTILALINNHRHMFHTTPVCNKAYTHQ